MQRGNLQKICINRLIIVDNFIKNVRGGIKKNMIENPKTLKMVIYSRPITKKNNPQAYCISGCKGWRRGCGPQPKKIIIPSKEYIEYEKDALKQLMKWGNIQYDVPVILTVFYWLPDRRSRPDLGNLLAATCDILQKAQILKDDSLVYKFGESCIMGVDKNRPRAEIIITELDKS